MHAMSTRGCDFAACMPLYGMLCVVTLGLIDQYLLSSFAIIKNAVRFTVFVKDVGHVNSRCAGAV
jgi:hypothetical protein